MVKNIGRITKQLKITLTVVSYIVYAIIVVSIITYTQRSWFELGGFMGILAMVSLWMVAIPGIIKRFNLQGTTKKIGQVLMGSRRQFGILMFLFALGHYLWLRAFGYIQNGFPDPESFAVYEKVGFFAFLLTIPLYLTSNNFSVRLLKRKWTWLHRLNYIIILLAIFHTALLSEKPYPFILITFVVFVAQVLSWVFVASQSKLSEAL
jgi:DMSO/TMAO reductase YedYZ heme-binding membrane subunit